MTPLVFMFGLCCTRICPYCAYCGYWNFLKKAMDNWTRRTRMIICMVVAFPLAISMVTVGAVSIERCSIQETSISSNVTITDNSLPMNQTKGMYLCIWHMNSHCSCICCRYDHVPSRKTTHTNLVIGIWLCGIFGTSHLLYL